VWLLPAFSALSRNILKLFYRLSLSGEGVPERGPVLLVANHPNSLLDPAMVAAVARRPVRFLAKAPLFGHPGLGWLVKGAGALHEKSRGLRLVGEVRRNAISRKGLLTTAPSHAGGYVKTRPGLATPDMQLYVAPASYGGGRRTLLFTSRDDLKPLP
jgi:hypothetical protein